MVCNLVEALEVCELLLRTDCGPDDGEAHLTRCAVPDKVRLSSPWMEDEFSLSCIYVAGV